MLPAPHSLLGGRVGGKGASLGAWAELNICWAVSVYLSEQETQQISSDKWIFVVFTVYVYCRVSFFFPRRRAHTPKSMHSRERIVLVHYGHMDVCQEILTGDAARARQGEHPISSRYTRCGGKKPQDYHAAQWQKKHFYEPTTLHIVSQVSCCFDST